ncbi:MAG: NosD domain-containing protein [Candidatus Bathyarchaeia archaeon]
MTMYKTLSKTLLTATILLAFFTYTLFTVYPSSGKAVASAVRTVSPGESIQEAINNANEGDVIVVMPGTYQEWPIIVNKTLTIVGKDLESTILDGAGEANVTFHIIANNVAIENFTIQNMDTSFSVQGTAIRIYRVTNITVNKIIVRNAYRGIELLSSNSTKITRCKISNSTWGIHLHEGSVNNVFVGNTIMNNSIGIYIADAESQYNVLYHNNFINNTGQASVLSINYFDNDYPFGGNYWSDHIKIDSKHGVGQDEDGGDGIVDEKYQKGGVLDNYPFLNPLTAFEISAFGENFEVEISTNSSLSSYAFNPEEKSLKLQLMGKEGTIGTCRISVPKRLLSCELPSTWTITLSNNGQLSYLALEDTEATYLYFTYSQSNSFEIEIRGTNAIPEFPLRTLLLILLTAVTSIILVSKRL